MHGYKETNLDLADAHTWNAAQCNDAVLSNQHYKQLIAQDSTFLGGYWTLVSLLSIFTSNHYAISYRLQRKVDVHLLKFSQTDLSVVFSLLRNVWVNLLVMIFSIGIDAATNIKNEFLSIGLLYVRVYSPLWYLQQHHIHWLSSQHVSVVQHCIKTSCTTIDNM